MDHELRRKKRIVTHFELSWNDWKPEKKTVVLRFGRDSNRYPPALKYALRWSVCEATSVKNISHLRLMIPFTNKLGIQSHRWNLASEFWTSPLILVLRASCLHPSPASCKFVNSVVRGRKINCWIYWKVSKSVCRSRRFMTVVLRREYKETFTVMKLANSFVAAESQHNLQLFASGVDT